jgi:glutamate--cysteine ligase
MSQATGARDETPIERKQQLVDYLAGGGKPKSAWRIGTEHEKFGFDRDTLLPPSYAGERGIRALLTGLQGFGWQPVLEDDHVIALLQDGCSITLEPAGQLELSGAPLKTIHDTCCEIASHLRQVRAVAEPMNLGFLGMGFQPLMARDAMPWMPKGRYAIMRRHMQRVGTLGLDMMTRTCTVQVNLDYADEADMVKKFRTSLALQPIATALFADSPFSEGQPNGFRSYRSHIWTDTDPARCGMLPFVFESGMGYERYVDYLLDVPMYFVYRDGTYIDAAGQSFRDFLAGKLPAYPGHKPTLQDFSDHLTTAFPEVRLKRYLEMRGADGGPWNRLCALPAFWVGLLYDSDALDAAYALASSLDIATQAELRAQVPRHGMAAKVGNTTVAEIAKQALAIAIAGLRRREEKNEGGTDESVFLEPLVEFAAAGKSPADIKLERFHGAWNGSIRPVFTEFAY